MKIVSLLPAADTAQACYSWVSLFFLTVHAHAHVHAHAKGTHMHMHRPVAWAGSGLGHFFRPCSSPFLLVQCFLACVLCPRVLDWTLCSHFGSSRS